MTTTPTTTIKTMTTEEPNDYADGRAAGWNEALEEVAQLADEDYSTWALADRIRALKREQ